MTKYLLAAWLGIAPLLSVAQSSSDVNALLATSSTSLVGYHCFAAAVGICMHR